MSAQDLSHSIKTSLQEGRRALDAFLDDASQARSIEDAARMLAACFAAGGKVISCGNGGSACDAIHFAEEFTGRFIKDRKPLPAIPLTDPGHLTCVGNDYGYDEVFARGVVAYGKPGDVLVGISTSGNSRNVIRAVEEARKLGMKVVLLLGKGGGALKGKADAEIWVRHEATERIQEVHMLALHVVIESVERILFPENYRG
ncbi:MAG TPA: SIS domain-containing protein [Geothrix sp.]|nr:SIS domain-containing protein [Geothrix sp.]